MERDREKTSGTLKGCIPMKNNENPLIGVGTLSISSRAKELVLEVLNNNRLSYGPFTQLFEKRFAQVHQCAYGIMSNSGTSALQVALQTLKEHHGWSDDDEVIVPSITFVATVNIVIHNRMKPVLVDVEPDFYEINPALIEEKITPRTRAIIVVHLFGLPVDMDPIRDIATRYNLKIIEDSCETMFASYKGRRVGSLGDIGCFSTYVAHLLITGVGGLNTTNNPEYAIKMRSLINHGRDSIYLSIDDDNNCSADELSLIIERRFKFVSVGHSYRATEMEAALGLAQLEESELMIRTRRAYAQMLIQGLSPLSNHLQLPKVRPGCEHSFMMFPIVLHDEPKEKLVQFLELNGIETRDMLPLTNQPVYKKIFDWDEEEYPVAKWINENGFYIGCHQDITEPEISYIIECFKKYFSVSQEVQKEQFCLVLYIPSVSEQISSSLSEIPYSLFSQIVCITEIKTDDSILPPSTRDTVLLIERRGRDSMRIIKELRPEIKAEFLIFYSLDGRYDISNISKIYFELQKGRDFVNCSRFIAGAGRQDAFGRVHMRSLGNRFFSFMSSSFFYGNITDTLSLIFGIRSQTLFKSTIPGTGYSGKYSLSIRAMKEGWNVSEIPVVETVPQKSNAIIQTIKDIFMLTYTLFKEYFVK